MARIRTIKPDFFTSEDIVSLSPLARLLFIATWLEADREGRFVWRPKNLKLRYLPGDNCDIDALTEELLDAGLVATYGANGQTYAEIPSFTRHQVINNRESESTIPARVTKALTTRATRVIDATTTPLTGKERKEGKEHSTRRVQDEQADEGFALFWDAYGKKTGKQNAISQWRKIRPDAELLNAILQAAKGYASSNEPKFRKDPERWLKERRWEDEIVNSQPTTNAGQADIFAGAI